MALPGNASKVNFDQASDDPEQARAEFADHVDKFNALLTHLGISAITNDPLTVGNGLVDGGAQLDIDLDTPSGLSVGASGLKVDINGTAAKTSPVAADSVLINDVAGSNVVKKATIPNLLKGGKYADLSDVIQLSSGEFVTFNGTNYVGGNPVAAGSVAQGKLKTASETETSGTPATLTTISGGRYAFWPDLKASAAGSVQQFVVPVSEETGDRTGNNTNLGTSFITRCNLGVTASIHTISARFLYIQASPPYNLGDGDIPLFIFINVDGTGKVLRVSISPDPLWANNGPTIIRPDVEVNGKKFRKVPKYTDGSISDLDKVKHVIALRNSHLRNPAKRDAFLQDLIDFVENDIYDLIEITHTIKNADMNGRGLEHPWVFGNDLTGTTTILLDPVSPLMEQLAALHEAGEDIADLLHEDFISFGNSSIGRAAPIGVMPVSAVWR